MYPYGPFQPHQSAPQPGPTHVYYTRGPRFMCRGPSRLIWFGIGGITTYWFIQSRERKREMLMSQADDTQRAGHCHSAWGWGRWGDHRREMNEAQQKMEDHRRKVQEQFADFGNLSSDKLADMAESSLDSVMSSVVALRALSSEQHRKLLEFSTKGGSSPCLIYFAFTTTSTTLYWTMATLAHFKVPQIDNEPMHSYAPGSSQRAGLEAALAQMQKDLPFEVPCIINGKEVKTGRIAKQLMPHDHANHLCTYHEAGPAEVEEAIKGPKCPAAELASGKYRYQLMAATMLGQGKNAWQAEIDAAAELTDFLRFGVKFVEELYQQQPAKNSPGVWNRVEYRGLEGFVLAVSPFNFTAIGGNLSAAPALVGNVIVWKPSPAATYSNYIVHKIFTEAGVPPGVIQFVPVHQQMLFSRSAIAHPDFAALHFTGSTHVFKQLWKDIASNMDKYKGYPRIVGETGGKNFHSFTLLLMSIAWSNNLSARLSSTKAKSAPLCLVYTSRLLFGMVASRISYSMEIGKISVGPPTDPKNFVGPVIGKPAFEKITSYIQKAKDAGGEILIGGSGDSSKGYFVQPTVILTKDPKSVTMVEEIFGPVLTIYVYDDEEFDETCKLIDSTTTYALTGSIFSNDRAALIRATNLLRHAAGNMYYNEKCTGAVVGQQPFGGARASGTNDKAGSISIFYRFVSARSIKEGFAELGDFIYPSNLV
ncbi:Delta-1-pyrroline-5-carboxylate dehydrogenase [Rhizoctonia solani]|uniref:Delta-1-pyrroline-5-carboxylate dehydrogenase n=1 Tax=Rhizoctonia solani TaxID=456999 RepID=A0A8H7I2U8_9AGAM|nr:Delta-1-pyrroline-5-carboxylate dehydrogenase [Rhizoctonia solani]